MKNSSIVKSKATENKDLKKLLSSVGSIGDPEAVYSYLKTLIGEEPDIGLINKSAESCERTLLKESGEQLEDGKGEHLAQFVLFDTGYKKKNTGEIIYISMAKGKLGLEGGYAGTFVDIKANIKSKYDYAQDKKAAEDKGVIFTSDRVEDNAKNKYAQEKQVSGNRSKSDELHDKIYEMLLNKEKFGERKNVRQSRIVQYVYIVSERVKDNIVKGIQNGYTKNCDGNKIVFNTGLLDKYMNDIYIITDLYQSRVNTVDFGNFEVCNSKGELVKAGFDVNDIQNMPEPVKMYDSIEQLSFRASIREFDLIDRRRIEHIFIERLQRFPDELQGASPDYLYGKVIKAIENSLKMQNRGYKYIQPMYNVERHSVQYLVPLHLNTRLEESPELVLIVGKENGFYMPMTVIDASDAYDNARVLGYPNCLWLQ